MSATWRIQVGDAIEVLREMAPGTIDAIVTDPPYGLGFMGKAWDVLPPGEELAKLMLEVAKPGAHLVAFGGTRTYHRLACALEDAGWQIRDQLAWVYGSGFPKSHNLEGQWSGWGTALKPAWEPIVLARKPLGGTVAANVLEHGTGALNVDGCRVETDDGYVDNAVTQGINTARTSYEPRQERRTFEPSQAGRWPANLAHDGSAEATAGMGDAARYFYTAKASSSERNAGLEGMVRQSGEETKERLEGSAGSLTAHSGITNQWRENHHPTVKPIALMRWLCRLITPPGGLILDPFLGSGSTMVAALQEGFRCVGIEREEQYAEIARRRVEEDAPLFNRERP